MTFQPKSPAKDTRTSIPPIKQKRPLSTPDSTEAIVILDQDQPQKDCSSQAKKAKPNSLEVKPAEKPVEIPLSTRKAFQKKQVSNIAARLSGLDTVYRPKIKIK
mmetsp:Transcript_31635/g.40644  ORF Transcript_31635/g.40644 Transcript_31635/m.40644 type:complete len:104 (-) Transcript_31635:135-446(-)|eukprot:CAMPEP_0117862998 /NCGR_PEP_ID=MMETSP0950-20121206/5320_1 /TAXON_ID=44440 /ORGANISM="Chattonella subsalsa, Strain CCMP2191" /LENGTH=103 /DNA_ID=CAMNT_0005713685 /DNA_START=1256 /DNA_END=1567 /DNA_ORIENTATION=-